MPTRLLPDKPPLDLNTESDKSMLPTKSWIRIPLDWMALVQARGENISSTKLFSKEFFLAFRELAARICTMVLARSLTFTMAVTASGFVLSVCCLCMVLWVRNEFEIQFSF